MAFRLLSGIELDREMKAEWAVADLQEPEQALIHRPTKRAYLVEASARPTPDPVTRPGGEP